MNSDQILKDTKDRMEKALNVFIEELKGLRTGRATPALVDNIKVDYYGSPTPLKQVAQDPITDPLMRHETPIPDYVANYSRENKL